MILTIRKYLNVIISMRLINANFKYTKEKKCFVGKNKPLKLASVVFEMEVIANLLNNGTFLAWL